MELLNEMQSQVTKNLLSYAVGRQIFCHWCRKVLDQRDAVNFELLVLDRRGNITVCGSCFDGERAKLETCGTVSEVIDGRVLFAKPKPDPNHVPDVNPIHAADVKVGDRYRINHSSSGFVTVKVVRLKTSHQFGGRRSMTHYVCINERTGRDIIVKSAAKFRGRVI